MKIAVTYEEGKVFQHFGHTAQFGIYEAEDGQIKSFRVLDTNGTGHGALAGILKEAGVDVLICGGIGGGARTALSEAGIALYPGVSGEAEEAARKLLSGNLDYDPNTSCNHHADGHSCGEDKHGCHGN